MMQQKIYNILFLFFSFYYCLGSLIPLHLIYTDSHLVLLEQWLLPSLQDSVEIIIHYLPQECPSGKFLQKGWKKTTIKKVEIIVEAIKHCTTGWFIYSDVDIQFFRPVVEELANLLENHDIVFQKDNPHGTVCSGFFACKANEKTWRLWERVLNFMLESNYSDQGALNYILKTNITDLGLQWNYLPLTYYGGGSLTGKMWKIGKLLKIPHNIALHHANWTIGITNKIAQLAAVKKMVTYYQTLGKKI